MTSSSCPFPADTPKWMVEKTKNKKQQRRVVWLCDWLSDGWGSGAEPHNILERSKRSSLPRAPVTR